MEFALVLPVFLMLLFGILAYGTYFSASHAVAQLAADAARASVAGLSSAESESLARSQVTEALPSYSLLNPGRLSITTGSLPDDPTAFKVTIRLDASYLPIWPIAAFVPLPSKIIERSAVVKRGGLCGAEAGSC